MTVDHPRYSTSDALLDVALDYARSGLGLETQSIRLRDLNFRACEGFYSKSCVCLYVALFDYADGPNRSTRSGV